MAQACLVDQKIFISDVFVVIRTLENYTLFSQLAMLFLFCFSSKKVRLAWIFQRIFIDMSPTWHMYVIGLTIYSGVLFHLYENIVKIFYYFFLLISTKKRCLLDLKPSGKVCPYYTPTWSWSGSVISWGTWQQFFFVKFRYIDVSSTFIFRYVCSCLNLMLESSVFYLHLFGPLKYAL